MLKHRFQLFLPADVWKAIAALAKRNRRPVTQEIIIAIEDHLDANGPWVKPANNESKDAKP